MVGPVPPATCPPFRTKDLLGHSAHLKAELRRQNEGRVRLSATPWTTARLSVGILQARMLEWAAISSSKMKDTEFIITPSLQTGSFLSWAQGALPQPKMPHQKTHAEGKETEVKGPNSIILRCVTKSKRQGTRGTPGSAERAVGTFFGYAHHSPDSMVGRSPLWWNSVLAHVKEVMGGRWHRWELRGAAHLSE